MLQPERSGGQATLAKQAGARLCTFNPEHLLSVGVGEKSRLTLDLDPGSRLVS